MEFPFGHHTHRNHQRDGGSGSDDFTLALPPLFDVYHTSHSPPLSLPQDNFASSYSSPYPPLPQIFSRINQNFTNSTPNARRRRRPRHLEPVAHKVDELRETHHSPRLRFPSFLRRCTWQQSDSGPADAASIGGAFGSYFANKPAYKVYCKTEPKYSLTIWDSKFILAPSDPSDHYQKWYKDEKFSTRVKDEEGSPCFSLVNMATGEAIKHSVGDSYPVQLVPYNPEQLDESVLWTESKDLGYGYRAVRMVNNVRLNLDAFHGDKKSGGVHDGTTIVLWQWNKGDNQRWKITPYCKFLRRGAEE